MNGQSLRDMIIEEDFGWLKSIKVHDIDGRLMLGDAELPFNVNHVMYENEFVKDWLMGFALGNHYGVNYFNVEKWCAMSNNGTSAVLVVDAERNPVMVIQPLIHSNLTKNDRKMLSVASKVIQSNHADSTKVNDPKANLALSTQLVNKMEAKPLTLTDMVPASFYEKYSINPSVEQMVYYIRDNINKGACSVDNLNRTREILFRDQKGEHVTRGEYEFVRDLSQGAYDITDKVANLPKAAVVGKAGQQNTEQGNDPFEC